MAKVIEFDFESGVQPNVGGTPVITSPVAVTNYAAENGANVQSTTVIDGSNSLEITTAAYSQVQVFNDTNGHHLAAKDEGVHYGTFHLQSGSYVEDVMLMMWDGKVFHPNNDPGGWPVFDSNDGIQMRLRETDGGSNIPGFLISRIASGQTFNLLTSNYEVPIGEDVTFAIFYSVAGALPDGKTIQIFENGREIRATNQTLNAYDFAAFHHATLGNDRSNVPGSPYYIDNIGSDDSFADARVNLGIAERGTEIFVAYQQTNTPANTNNNYNAFVSSPSGTTISNAVDKDGNATSVSVSIETISGTLSYITNAPNMTYIHCASWVNNGDTDIEPTECMQIVNGSVNTTFGGLDNSKQYMVEVLYRTYAERISEFSVDGFTTSQKANGRYNDEHTMRFTDISPSSGEIVLSMRNGDATDTAGVQVVRLIELVAASTSLDVTPGAGAGNAYSPTPAIQLLSAVDVSATASTASASASDPAIQFASVINVTGQAGVGQGSANDPLIQFSDSLTVTAQAASAQAISTSESIEFTSPLLVNDDPVAGQAVAPSPILQFISVINVLADAGYAEAYSPSAVVQIGDPVRIGAFSIQYGASTQISYGG